MSTQISNNLSSSCNTQFQIAFKSHYNSVVIIYIKTYETEFFKRKVSSRRYMKRQRKMGRMKCYHCCKFHMLPRAVALSLEKSICPLVTQIKGERKQAGKVKLLGVNKSKPIGFIDCTAWLCRVVCIFHLCCLEKLGERTLKTYVMYCGTGFLTILKAMQSTKKPKGGK